MKTFIALTLLFAAVASGLAISRQLHGYRATRVWHFLFAAGFAACMMVWFAFAAVWEYWHG